MKQAAPTEIVRSILSRSREVANEWGHDRIDTGDVLLALIAAKGSLAVDLLRNVDVEMGTARDAVESRLARGDAAEAEGALRFTQAVRLALELARAEAARLGDGRVDSGHLLLGLLRERDGVAAQALAGVRLTEEIVEEEAAALREDGHAELPAKGLVHFVGLGDDGLPVPAREVLAAVLADLGYVHDDDAWPTAVIAFAPEEPPSRMFRLGIAAAYRVPIVLLLRPGEAVHPLLAKRVFRVPLDDSLEANLRISLSP